MKELLEKISSYNLFNYLLPGVLYVTIIGQATHYDLMTENLIMTFFICYFIGMSISRVGSLVIEPVMKKLKMVKFTEYKDFIIASKQDSKLEILSEQNNSYRSLIAMIMIIAVTIAYEKLESIWPFLVESKFWFLLVLLFVLFLLSYRKQIKYIKKRIEQNLD